MADSAIANPLNGGKLICRALVSAPDDYGFIAVGYVPEGWSLGAHGWCFLCVDPEALAGYALGYAFRRRRGRRITGGARPRYPKPPALRRSDLVAICEIDLQPQYLEGAGAVLNELDLSA